MLRFKTLHLYIYFGFFLLNSCTNSHEYKIDPAFEMYLQRFEYEGAIRGIVLDPQTSGLKMEFGTLSNNTAGLTHYETPVRIQFDKAYWDAISMAADADSMKEDLVFHELGHGLLGRRHLNSVLPNGDWKSIMCGGTMVDNRPWNINYRGVRRKYYLDELFHVNTESPDFASMTLAIDTAGFRALYQLNFNDNSQSGWKLGEDASTKLSLDNGRLLFQSKTSQVFLVFLNLQVPLSINSDFSYELTFNYPNGDATNLYGLAFNSNQTDSTGTKKSVEYFTINNNSKMHFGNRTCYSFFTELTESAIQPNGTNKLKVFKIGTFLYYFINNVYVYCSEITASTDLNQFGFVCPPLSSIWIDNFIISVHGKSTVQAKIKQVKFQSFSIQPIDDLTPHTVRNK